MSPSPELTAAEQELNAARASFHIARLALKTTLLSVRAREGASDRLINHADEYGVDHALSVLATNPASLDLPSLSQTLLASISAQLQAAYDANHRVDRAMAARENLARLADPARAKAFIAGDREIVLDPATGSLHDRATGTTMPAHAKVIEPRGDMDSDSKKERDR
mgnify:CR=1 FL=1